MSNSAAGVALLASLAMHVQADPHDVFGTFATESGDSHVTITDCGNGTPCGRVSWIDPASLEDGLTPETATVPATGEPVLNLLMLSEFERSNGDWRKGRIYDPRADKAYTARIKRLDDQSLEVKGCIAFFCQTQVWSEAKKTAD